MLSGVSGAPPTEAITVRTIAEEGQAMYEVSGPHAGSAG
jgi:hypothetical protein